MLAAPVLVHAAEPPAEGIPGLTGPRALALAASVGVAGGNDAIFSNPAALAARRRYSVDALFFTDERQAGTAGRYFGGSVVDSVTGPMAAAIAYERATEGPWTGNLWRMAFAGSLAEGLMLGASGNYYDLKGPRNAKAMSADAGLFWQPARYLSLGAAGYNLVPIANDAIAPLGAAAGFAVGSDASFQVSGDWRATLPQHGSVTNRWSAGAEYLLADLVPLRAGYAYDDGSGTQWWSAGVGIVTRSVALDVAYRQSFDAASAKTIAVALRIFPFQQ